MQAPRGKQFKISCNIVNVPADVKDNLECQNDESSEGEAEIIEITCRNNRYHVKILS